jgi:O-antigen/teichoic acid export membrane protein
MALSTIVAAFGNVLVARLLSPAEFGLVAIAWITPTLVSLFRDWGVSTAIVKYIAQYKSTNEGADIRSVVTGGLFFVAFVGSVLSLSIFLAAPYLARELLGRPDLSYLIQVSSISVFAGGLVSVSQSVFAGLERMSMIGITMIVQSATSAVIGPLLVVGGWGVRGAVFGLTIAILATAALSIVLVCILLMHDKGSDLPARGHNLFAEMGKLLHYGLPISASGIAVGAATQFYLFWLAVNVSDSSMGNYQAASNLVVLIAFFSVPISTVLLPAFSKYDNRGLDRDLSSSFRFSVKISALLVSPLAMAMMALSGPAIHTLFGTEYVSAPLFAAFIAVNYLYPSVGSLCIGSFLKGLSETWAYFRLTLCIVVTGLPLGYLLIPRFGVEGLIMTTIVAEVPFIIGSLWYIEKRFQATVDWSSTVRILVASAISGALSYSMGLLIPLNDPIKLIAGGSIFLMSFLILAPSIGAIRKGDIRTLMEIAARMGPIRFVILPMLGFSERVLVLMNQERGL